MYTNKQIIDIIAMYDALNLCSDALFPLTLPDCEDAEIRDTAESVLDTLHREFGKLVKKHFAVCCDMNYNKYLRDNPRRTAEPFYCDYDLDTIIANYCAIDDDVV